MRKYHWLSLLGLLISFPLTARDFSYTYEGSTVNYNILDEDAKTCEVRSVDIDNSGKLIIPEIAIDGDSQYSVVAIHGDASFGHSITSVSIPKSINRIPYNPFRSSFSLTEINVDPDNPNFASYKGALYNKELTELIAVAGGSDGNFEIPNSVIRVCQFAFGGCMKLKSITIPNSVEYIEYLAFWACNSLTSLTFPASVTEIEQPLWDCQSMTEINVDPDNLNFASFEGALYSKGKKDLIAVANGIKGALVIPSSVKTIKDRAFFGCRYLTSVLIPGSVEEIGEFSFQLCAPLTDIYVASDNPNYSSFEGALYNKDQSVLMRVGEGREGHFVIPPSVEKIGSNAFSDCYNLTSVFISASVKEIDVWAFHNIRGMNVYCAAKNPPSCAENAFDENNYKYGTLYIPVGSKPSYELFSVWPNFKNIVEFDFAGIDDVVDSESSTSLQVKDGRICVMNKPAKGDVTVYTIQGQIVAQTFSEEVDGLPSGIYIVTVGSRYFKVIL